MLDLKKLTIAEDFEDGLKGKKVFDVVRCDKPQPNEWFRLFKLGDKGFDNFIKVKSIKSGARKAFKLTENLQNGQVVLLENLRFYAEEKKGDSSFAMKLAKHGDVYINDAFGTAHRAHASTAVIANYFKENKMFGHLLESEIKSVEKVLGSDGHPLTAIVVSTKVG